LVRGKKTIKGITEETAPKSILEDSGVVTISAVDGEKAKRPAKLFILKLNAERLTRASHADCSYRFS